MWLFSTRCLSFGPLHLSQSSRTQPTLVFTRVHQHSALGIIFKTHWNLGRRRPTMMICECRETEVWIGSLRGCCSEWSREREGLILIFSHQFPSSCVPSSRLQSHIRSWWEEEYQLYQGLSKESSSLNPAQRSNLPLPSLQPFILSLITFLYPNLLRFKFSYLFSLSPSLLFLPSVSRPQNTLWQLSGSRNSVSSLIHLVYCRTSFYSCT
jgi:hypothetical protein